MLAVLAVWEINGECIGESISQLWTSQDEWFWVLLWNKRNMLPTLSLYRLGLFVWQI